MAGEGSCCGGGGAGAFEDEAEPTVTIGEYIEGIEAEELEADLVLGGDDGKECTYGGGYLKRQAVFSCLTCVPDGVAGVCTACSLACHDGHEVVELWTKRKFRCDCGNSKYVGNVHPNVTESLLIEVFQSSGLVERCKLIRKEKSSFGFVDYYDRRSAALAIMTLHGRHICGQAIKVNWAYASTQREDTSVMLESCGITKLDAPEEAETAITEMTGKWLGSRQIRCNWATKNNAEEKQETDNHNAVVLTNGSSSNPGMEASQDTGSKENPENNPDCTTVYVGNLGHEVNRDELHRHFYNLGVGAIEEVRVQQDKGFGFVRYSNHGEAALAIQMANGLVVRGKPIKCSWGNKPTPPGTSSKPLPPPLPSYQPVPMAAGQIAGQHGLAGQVSAGLLAAGSQALYDGYPNQSSAQQLMYYN
uniref:RRM domain-containing protein n=1 Tax=Oryza meridionalis TaxID=40149 RepID=A0A0E0CEF6_9ORYZ